MTYLWSWDCCLKIHASFYESLDLKEHECYLINLKTSSFFQPMSIFLWNIYIICTSTTGLKVPVLGDRYGSNIVFLGVLCLVLQLNLPFAGASIPTLFSKPSRFQLESDLVYLIN